jgi:hypothetical protein
MDQLAKGVLKALWKVPCGRDDWTELLDLSLERQLPLAEELALRKIDEIQLERVSRLKDWLWRGLRGCSKAKNNCTSTVASRNHRQALCSPYGWETAFQDEQKEIVFTDTAETEMGLVHALIIDVAFQDELEETGTKSCVVVSGGN